MTECNRCKGGKFVVVKLRDMSGKQPHGLGITHVIGCPQCDGKGFITDKDISDYYRRWQLR